MAIAFVQAKSVQTGGATSITTPSMTSTAGNFLTAGAANFNVPLVAGQITDNKASTWQNAWLENGGGTGFSGQYYAENIPGGSGHTVTFTPSGSSACALAVGEFSGIATSSSLDKTAHAASAVEPHTSGATATTTLADELLIGLGSVSHAATVPTTAGALTLFVALGDSSPEGIVAAYQIVSATGAYTFTFSHGDTRTEATGVSTFKGATAPITGTGDVTIGAPAIDGTGDVGTTSTGGVTIGAPAIDGTGAVGVTGTGGVTIGAPAIAGTGAAGITGTGAVAIGAPSIAGIGDAAPPAIARVTQVAAEVFGTFAHPARVTQTVLEVFGRTPEVTFINDRVPGITHIEITLSDDTVEPWSVIPMDDPLWYDYGRKPSRVLSWGDIRRASSDFYGQSVAADFKFTVRDKDLHVLGYLGDPANVFVNRYTVTRSIGDPDRRQQLKRRIIFRGPIRSVAPRAGATHDFTVKDYLQERFGPSSDTANIPRRKVLKEDFDGCETELVNSSAEQYVVDGALGLTQVIDGETVDTTVIAIRDGVGTFAADQITFAGHATVYTVSASSLDDPETEITINPALTATVADGEAITQIPTHRVTPAKGTVVPVRAGLITDRHIIDDIDTGDGQGKSTYVGDEVLDDGYTYGIWVWACHGCYSPSGRPIQQIYFWNQALDNLAGGSFYVDNVLMAMTIGDLGTEAGSGGRVLVPGYDNWDDNGFTGSYVDRHGRRYVIYGLRGIFRDWALGIRPAPMNLSGIPHSVNAYGMDSTLDGLGAEVRDLHDQFVLAFNNFGVGDYQSGAPLADPTFPDDPSLTLLDLASLARAKAQGATLVTGGFRGDWSLGVDNEQITMAELIKRFVRCLGVEQSWNRKTQFCVDRQSFDPDLTMADAPTLTDERDIRKQSFEIDEAPSLLFTALPFVHTRDELGRATGGWRSTAASYNVADSAEEYADDVDTIAKYSPSGTKLLAQRLEFHWLRGKNRTTDADEYQQGSDTINAILAYKLAMAKVRIFSLTTWGKGYAIEIFDRLWIQHLANVGGRTPRPARVIEHLAQPDKWRVTLKCFDLGTLLVDLPRSELIVADGGSGGGTYVVGSPVPVVAPPAPTGAVFDTWTGGTVVHPTAPVTVVVIPPTPVTITPTYRLLPVVPGASGFGMGTRAAYGGAVAPVILRVTNLNDSGAGSLRAALEGVLPPRVVIFETSGYVDLASDIVVTSPYLTVAGQTAPSPGITLRSVGDNDGLIMISTHDVLIQHLADRPGAGTCNSAVLVYGGAGVYNVVLDHVSLSWAQDEGIFFGQGVHDCTLWRSIVAEILVAAPGSGGCSGGGVSGGHGVISDSHATNIAILQNLLAQNVERNALAKGGSETYVGNNVLYNPIAGPLMLDSDHVGDPSLMTAVGNYLKRGSTDLTGTDLVAFGCRYLVAGSQLYLDDNTLDNGSAPPAFTPFEIIGPDGIDPRVGSPPITVPDYTPLSASAAYTLVLASAGARPADRDDVDLRVVADVVARTGTAIAEEGDVGGFPTLAENTGAFTIPIDPHAVQASGYTNLEERLHAVAAAVGA